MKTSPVADRIGQLYGTVEKYMRHQAAVEDRSENVSDFITGNPQEMPSPRLTDILQEHLVPQNKDWYAYKFSETESKATVASALKDWKGIDVDAEDVAMTNGGFGAIAAALHAVVNPGDEVIVITPLWFCYELLVTAPGGVPVRVSVNPDTFDLDLDAIRSAITPKTRAILLNNPHNPTGKIYSKQTLQQLADILTTASKKNDHNIYLLSDEAFSRLIFDGIHYVSPATIYPNTIILYSYGKTLLAPGQRLGYIAVPQSMPDRKALGQAFFATQVALGFLFPNALMQYAIADLDTLCMDIEHLQYKRDWLVREMRRIGYDVTTPSGTFFMFPRSPIADDWKFADVLREHDIFVIPGSVLEMSGYFRMSLTASDEMIERAIPNFKKAYDAVT